MNESELWASKKLAWNVLNQLKAKGGIDNNQYDRLFGVILWSESITEVKILLEGLRSKLDNLES